MSKGLARRREVGLYKSASFLFNKHGYTSTSIRQICKAVGIREGSIYYYIKKKEDLLYNICERSMVQSLEAIEPILRSDLRSDLKLQKMIETHIITIAIAQNANQHSTMLKELRALSASNQNKIIKLRDRYEGYFRKVVSDCVKEKLFRGVNIKFTTLALLGMMNWLIHWYSPQGPIKSNEIAKIFSELFLKGPKR